MKIKTFGAIGAAFMLCVIATVAYGHHSPAAYNLRETLTVQGAVKRIDWFNPHVYVYVEETLDTGEKVTWEVEAFPPAILRRTGWTRDTVRIGDVLTIIGNPTKNRAERGLFPSSIKQADRRLFTLNNLFDASAARAHPCAPPHSGSCPSAPQSPTPTNSGRDKGLDGVWSTPIAINVVAQVVSPQPRHLTAEGVAARKRFREKSSPTSHCIPSPPPWWMFTPELKRITTSGQTIVIENELGVRRTIHMDVSSHDGTLPSIQGHSIGRWEGKTLVIETANFAYHGTGNGGGNGLSAGVPSGTQKRLVERLTLMGRSPNAAGHMDVREPPNPEGTSISYSYELTDPEFVAVPRKGSLTLTLTSSARFEVEPCKLDTARRFIKE